MKIRAAFLAVALAFSLGNADTDEIQALVNEGRDAAAFEMANRAAESGDPRMHEWLGWFYDNGRGVEADSELAIHHYRVAIAGGQNFARWRLGVMVDTGEAPGTLEEAVGLFRAAADDGFTNAMVSLAVMQATGRGTPQDYTAAMANYMRAARAGNAHGIQGIGVLFERGEGVERSLREAAAWFLVAATQGNETGDANFRAVTEHLAPDEMAGIAKRAEVIARELGFEIEIEFEPYEEPATDPA